MKTNTTIVNNKTHILNTEVGLHVFFRQQSGARNKTKELFIHVFPSLLLCKCTVVLVKGVEIQTIQPSKRKGHFFLDILWIVWSTVHHAESTAPTLATRFPVKIGAAYCSLCCDSSNQQRNTRNDKESTHAPSSFWSGKSTDIRPAPWHSSYCTAAGICPKRRFQATADNREAPLYDHRREFKTTWACRNTSGTAEFRSESTETHSRRRHPFLHSTPISWIGESPRISPQCCPCPSPLYRPTQRLGTHPAAFLLFITQWKHCTRKETIHFSIDRIRIGM